MGLVVAVPVGPLGLLCINRSLAMGPTYGLFSGLGVATADALAAGIAALGITLISGLLSQYQVVLRFIGGAFLCYLGYTIYITEPVAQAPIKTINGFVGAYATTFFLTFSNPVTILSFVAIYAGWHVPDIAGRYTAAAILTAGVFTGSAAEARVKASALAGTLDDYRLTFESGEAMTGRFLVTRLDYAGDYNGERSYTLALESSGAVVSA